MWFPMRPHTQNAVTHMLPPTTPFQKKPRLYKPMSSNNAPSTTVQTQAKWSPAVLNLLSVLTGLWSFRSCQLLSQSSRACHTSLILSCLTKTTLIETLRWNLANHIWLFSLDQTASNKIWPWHYMWYVYMILCDIYLARGNEEQLVTECLSFSHTHTHFVASPADSDLPLSSQ